jgi:hypothetical protein
MNVLEMTETEYSATPIANPAVDKILSQLHSSQLTA